MQKCLHNCDKKLATQFALLMYMHAESTVYIYAQRNNYSTVSHAQCHVMYVML